MSSSLDHKCQRCGSQYHGQICPFCTITGLDVNALLASEGLTMPEAPASNPAAASDPIDAGTVLLLDIVSNRTYPISMPVCRFGRDISNDIVLTGDKSLSRFHFQLTSINGEYYVEDSGSRNGSFLNGSPVTAPRKLVDGDIISAGMSRYRFALNAASMAEHTANDTNAAAAAEAPQAGEAPHARDAHDSEGNGNGVATQEVGKGSASEDAVDPLQRIFQEGQALMGNTDDDADHPADLDHFFKNKEEEEEKAAKLSTFMQLDGNTETPVDDLFEPPALPSSNELPLAPAFDMSSEAAAFISSMQQESFDVPSTFTAFERPTPAETNGSQTAKAEDELVIPPCPTAPIVENRNWPEWCTDYNFDEIEQMRERMSSLMEEIEQKETELSELQARVEGVESMKNRLLATRNGEFVEACSSAFQLLGFTTELNNEATNEVVLSEGGKAVAIAKIVCTDSQPKPAELANLVSALSTYWVDHGVEPKGLIIVAFATDGPPADRPNVGQDYADYAAKKNVCLMSSLQLLTIYRDVALRAANVESIKSALLSASGQLSGYELTAPSENNHK